MHSANLEEIVILLLAAVLIVSFFKRLHLSPVLGYLVAGGIIGPYGLQIIKDINTASLIAEFGVVFLLFYIGLELSFERFKALRSQIFVFGTLQFLITALLIGFVAYKMGVSMEAAIIIGAGLALSSTAIVLQSLADRGEQSTQVGRLALAVLILQDLAVVPLFILVPLLTQEATNLGVILLNAFQQTILAFVVILVFGRLFLRPFFRLISETRSDELFTATTLLIVLAAAWQTGEAGLSMAFGAFMAGLLVAETEFRHQVESDIRPFKSLLLGLFFMTVGMKLDFSLLFSKLWLIAGLTLWLMLTKGAIIMMLCRIFRFKTGASLHSGILLSQGSEFAFVLLALPATMSFIEPEISQILLVVVTVSMAITPLLALAGRSLAILIDKPFAADLAEIDTHDLSKETFDLGGHVVVGGFGRVGKTVCQLLSAENINYIALDVDPRKVRVGRKKGFAVFYGNADNLDILKSVGMGRARAAVVTQRERDQCVSTIHAIRKAYPNIPIIARAIDRANAQELKEAGASIAIAEAFESSLALGSAILKTSGIPNFEINRVIQEFRKDEYPISLEEYALNQGLMNIADEEKPFPAAAE